LNSEENKPAETGKPKRSAAVTVLVLGEVLKHQGKYYEPGSTFTMKRTEATGLSKPKLAADGKTVIRPALVSIT